MKSNGRKFTKNSAAFTGLEAAIVLIAFVVVAAVFSYVMLGAGFFTSQKSKEVVHTGVDQASSSLQLSGDIIGVGDTVSNPDELDGAKITLSLTAGNNPVDMGKLVVSYKTDTFYDDNIYVATDGATPGYQFITEVDDNTLLEQNEKVQINLDFPELGEVGVNTRVWLEIKPATGAIIPITFSTPPVVDSIMVLM
jgi:flagellin FlaB